MRSCQDAFDEMARAGQQPPFDFRRPQPLAGPVHLPAPEIAERRLLPPNSSTNLGRFIQPRPPHPYPPDVLNQPPYMGSPTGEGRGRKKRGRPTKAEAQARAEAAAARGETYPPPAKRSKPGRSSSGAAEGGPMPMTPGSAPPIAPLTTPPRARSVHAPSETPSTGRRKRGRPSKTAKPEEQEEQGLSQSQESSSGLGPPYMETTPSGPSDRPVYAPPHPIGPLAHPAVLEHREQEPRMEGTEEFQHRTTTPHSFKDTVGI